MLKLSKKVDYALIALMHLARQRPGISLSAREIASGYGLPPDLLAKVDRAGLAQRFFFITLPILKPVLVVAFLFRTIQALQIFDVVYVLTRGGPGGSTTSLSLFAYQYFAAGDFGYGAAAGMILFLVALGLSLLYLRLGGFGKKEDR